MKKIILTAICFATALPLSYCQDQEPLVIKEKKFDHQVGVQVNGLIRQVFNFSNNNPALDNPYIVFYSINLRKSGWGLRVGGGFNNRFVAENDGIVENESTIKNINARLGIEKSFKLSDKWTTGVGVDGVYGNDYNKTYTVTRSFDTVTVRAKTTTKDYGGGVMAWLRYAITDKILLGTETSFYQRFGTLAQDVTITTSENNIFPGGGSTTTTSKQEHKLNEGIINLPIAIYLIVKF